MEHKENIQSNLPHQLVLQQRKMLDLEGVVEVAHFDEQTVIVDTTQGELTIDGEGLHVRQLNLEAGVMTVEGRIDGVTYRDAKKGGFLGRVLR